MYRFKHRNNLIDRLNSVKNVRFVLKNKKTLLYFSLGFVLMMTGIILSQIDHQPVLGNIKSHTFSLYKTAADKDANLPANSTQTVSTQNETLPASTLSSSSSSNNSSVNVSVNGTSKTIPSNSSYDQTINNSANGHTQIQVNNESHSSGNGVDNSAVNVSVQSSSVSQ